MTGTQDADQAALPAIPTWVLLLGIALVHLPLLSFGFVYDDTWTIVTNGFLRDPDFGALFDGRAIAAEVPDAGRPIAVAFEVALYQTVGLHAPTHHAVSIALHLTVCGLLGVFLGRLGAPLSIRWAAIAIFGLMAVHAETVSVPSYREDLLATAAVLAAMIFAFTPLRGPAAASLWLAAALIAALACLAKLSAAVLPLLYLVFATLSPWPRASESRIAGASSLFIGVLLGGISVLALHDFASPYSDDPAVGGWWASGISLANLAPNLVAGFAQMVAPLGLSPEYAVPRRSFSDPLVWLTGGLVLLAISLAMPDLRRRSGYALALLGALVAAVPTSGLIALPNVRADRFAYLPSVAVAIGLAIALQRVGTFSARRSRRFFYAPLGIYLLIQGSAQYAAATCYASNQTLWQVAVERAPASARAHAMVGLGALASASGAARRDPAVLARVRASCLMANELDPDEEHGHLCAARLSVAEKQWESAYSGFELARARTKSRRDRISAAIGDLALDLPEPLRTQAMLRVRRDLVEQPWSADLHASVARLEHRLGHPDLALALYRRARSLRPERWETIASGVELALDIGNTHAAQRTMLEYHSVLSRADPIVREHLARRLVQAKRLKPVSTLESLSQPGVFP